MRNSLIASELEQETNFKNRKDFYSSLAYLAMMPFHHLLSAQEIYSSIFNQSATIDTSKESISKDEIPPADLWRLIHEATYKQNPDSADPNMLDDSISAEFFETGHIGEQIKTKWTVAFRDNPFQGSAEIYRAEMFLFKQLIYKRKEKLGDILIFTNKDFAKYLDYEMFVQLTSGEPERLLLDSLTSLYQISVIPSDDVRANSKTTSDSESQRDKSNKQSDYHFTNKDSKKSLHSHIKFTTTASSILSDRVHSWKSIPITGSEASEYIINSLFENISEERCTAAELLDGHTDPSHHMSREFSDESTKIMLYKLNLGSYWRKWQQAAQTAEFDFGLLEKLEDVRAIRFYELTKFLRLELFDETTQSLPDNLEIEYELFTKLMPSPTFRTKDEIERQIAELIKPLKTADHIKSFSIHKNSEIETKSILLFQFN